MKIILHFLALLITITHVAQGGENHAQKILDQLIAAEGLHEKDLAIRRAREINTKAVNEALIKYLDDPLEDGARQRDFRINAPWKSALGILLKRFPLGSMDHLYVEYNKTVGKELNYRYMERKDAELFKKWWLENHQKIIYSGDGTHLLKNASQYKKSSESEIKKYFIEQSSKVEKISKPITTSNIINYTKKLIDSKSKADNTNKENKFLILPMVMLGVLMLGIFALLIKLFNKWRHGV